MKLLKGLSGRRLKYIKYLAPDYWRVFMTEALCKEFEFQDIAYKRQIKMDVTYKGHIISGQRIDMLVENEVIV